MFEYHCHKSDKLSVLVKATIIFYSVDPPEMRTLPESNARALLAPKLEVIGPDLMTKIFLTGNSTKHRAHTSPGGHVKGTAE